ncbi:uncharacterized protein TM35_000212900 [Trypanosoma theileri]|uniref:Uncharacterized protein n=1 Tax=Trypanosoma theileri TaxID=67003 RepID=A0A1X0NSL2_9TRYP|nr:uncharacterized protein TM35_000212900 [Trypanosoma theileri]ORC87684.1 hypothetical protein TM35_000212900 [Trypanosoma theileri]
MDVSRFLKEFKRARKETNNSGVISHDKNSEESLASTSLPGELARHQQNTFQEDDSDVSEQGNDDDNNDENVTPFSHSGGKRQRYDNMFSRKDKTAPREGYAEIRMYQTNSSVAPVSVGSSALRRRAPIPLLPRATAKKNCSSVTDALRSELLRKKNSLSQSALVEEVSVESGVPGILQKCTTSVSDDDNPSAAAVEALLISVDDLLSSSNATVEQQFPIDVISNVGVAAIKEETQTESMKSQIIPEIIQPVETSHEIPKKGKISMFARAKLLSTESGAEKISKTEVLETRKFSK